MSETTQAPDQQPATGTQPTGAVQPQPQTSAAPSPGQQANPPQSDPATDWEKRYKGLQSLHQQTLQQAQQAQASLTELQQRAGTLEQQLGTTMEERTALATSQEQLNAQLVAAQQENQFWTLVTSEFPALAQVAPYIQRAPDAEQQREILTKLAQTMGAQATQQAHQQIAQNFAGATPGATPVAGGNPMTPSYEDVMAHVMDSELQRSNPTEYAKWWAIYEEHPQMNYQSLGLGEFHDPFQTHYQSMQRAQGQTPAPLNARTQVQAVERDTGASPGMPGAWGSPIPPGGNK